ncbi:MULTISPECIES: TMEM175 family protein [unclassified Enterococcus]|uniref:TMEM175 family protein n=1 Tax=unclassified Enterococcus TaxID=2608891 RepID=UPI0013EDB9FF|nr:MULTISPECIES: TMEM175 family protein [unclassified Enterococcus]
MTKSRLEALTDGVVAIVLTVLVLDIKIPDPAGFQSLWNIRNTLLAYAISFIFVGVIWVNHHRVFQMADKINYRVVWANIFWLFWLTLCPSVTSWVGRNPGEFWPELSYVLVYTMWSFSFGILMRQVMKANEPDSHVVRVLSKDHRSALSMFINLCLIVGVFFVPMIGLFGRFFVSGIWILSYRKAESYFRHLVFYKHTKDE